MKRTLSILFFFLSISPVLQAQNPFEEMAGKPYREYSERIRFLYDDMAHADSLARFALLEQLRETARQSGDRNLELEARLWETQLCQSETYGLSAPYPVEEAIRDRLAIAETARKEKRPHIRAKALSLVIESYRLYLKDYDLTFEYLQELGRMLDTVPVDEMPEKVRYMLDIANLYYWFGDYERAGMYFVEIARYPEAAGRQSVLAAAYNGLGLIYRYRDDDLQRSDSMFRAILDIEPLPGKRAAHGDVWSGVARGNLGNNACLRGDYDAALPHLIYARDKTLEYYDHDYSAGAAIALADIYLRQGEITSAKEEIDYAREHIAKAFKSNKLRLLYPVLAKYYAATDKPSLAAQYLDSAMVARDDFNNEFHTVKLLRADQRLHRQQLDSEKVRTQGYRRVAVTVSAALVSVFALLVVIIGLYRKKRIAYQELVRKNQRWAGLNIGAEDLEIAGETPSLSNERGVPSTPAENGNVSTQREITEADLGIISKIEAAMTDRLLYKNTDFDLDMLASAVGETRYAVSGALNRCLCKNFYTYIGEYRVKEAVRVMSAPGADKLSIDGIAFEAGFSDRTSFYRIFKKATGLSPSAFRKALRDS